MKQHDQLSDNRLALEPIRLLPRHRQLMRFISAGYTISAAAKQIGITVSRASIIINSPIFQTELNHMQQELDTRTTDKIVEDTFSVKQRLEQLAEPALETLGDCLEAESEAVRVSAAREILDRAGYVREDKIQQRMLVEPTPGLIAVLNRIAADQHKPQPTSNINDNVNDNVIDGDVVGDEHGADDAKSS